MRVVSAHDTFENLLSQTPDRFGESAPSPSDPRHPYRPTSPLSTWCRYFLTNTKWYCILYTVWLPYRQAIRAALYRAKGSCRR